MRRHRRPDARAANDEIVAEFIGTHLSAEEVFRHGAAKEALYRDLIRPEIDRRLVPA